MSHELWATYSVKDHCTPRALAADIMLFDRLVFPVPQTPRIEGHEHEPGPVLWEKNPAEWERWAGEHWDPEGQRRVLGWIEPVVRKLAWSSEAAIYGEYQAEAAKLAAQKLPDYAFYATRTTLTRDLPAYVTGVAAVGPAYRSITEIERDLRIRSASSQLPGGAVASVLAWEFFAPDPDDPKISDEKLLRETVAFVTGDAEFRKSRAAFNDWQQGFVREGANGGEPVTDLESVKRAVERMSDLLADARQAAEQLTVRKIARYAFRLAPPAVNLTAWLAARRLHRWWRIPRGGRRHGGREAVQGRRSGTAGADRVRAGFAAPLWLGMKIFCSTRKDGFALTAKGVKEGFARGWAGRTDPGRSTSLEISR